MGRSNQEEYQRVLGFRASSFPVRALRPPEAPGAGTGGEPTGRSPGESGAGPASHPVLWLRWRRAVRRDGPHTPDFAEYCRRPLARPPAGEGPGPTG